MHGGEFQHKGYTAGRGFIASMSEPTSAPADPAEPDDATTPQETWAQIHGGMVANYETRLAAHTAQSAKFQRSEETRAEQRQVRSAGIVAGGQFGMKRYWQGRTELSGTPSYANDWLTMRRPAIHEALPPQGGKKRETARTTTARELQAQGAALRDESSMLELTKEYRGSDRVEPDNGSVGAATTLPTTAPSVLSGGPASSFPRGGALPKGSQWSGIRFEPMT